MRRQEFVGGAEKNLDDALGAGMVQQGIEQLSRHTQLPAAKRRGNEHFPQRRLPRTDILQSDGADDFVIRSRHPEAAGPGLVEFLDIGEVRLIRFRDRECRIPAAGSAG